MAKDLNIEGKVHPEFPRYLVLPTGSVWDTLEQKKLISQTLILYDEDGNGYRIKKSDLKNRFYPNKVKRDYNPKYDKETLIKVKRYSDKFGWSKAIRKFNIPLGSLSYIMKKINGNLPKGNKDNPIVINIRRVIIKLR